MNDVSPIPQFRAWDSEIGWVLPANVQNALVPVTHIKFGFKLKSRFVLSQFTGIQDCNGRDIYDGDILEGYMATGHGRSPRKRLWRFLVKWNTWSHGWSLYTETDATWRFLPSFGQCAVIGNRWENPEWAAKPGRVPPIQVPVDVL